MTVDPRLARRARVHAALSDPARLAIVDALAGSDRSPVELRRLVGVASNLLAHHLDVLEAAGVVERSRSSGDGRRRYVHLRPTALAELGARPTTRLAPALFVCTANSARSPLAAAVWEQVTGQQGTSAGTHPAPAVHPGAVVAAGRADLDLTWARPRALRDVHVLPPLVITVCDRAHEELEPTDGWLHWSIPDPVPVGTAEAFDAAVDELRARARALASLAAAT